MVAFVYALVFAATLFLSAALLFLAQAMIGKASLLRLGGTPAVWNTCLVFFQAILLAGYLYAHLLHKLPGKRWQPVFHLALFVIPLLLFLPFNLAALNTAADGHLVLGTFWLLLVLVGPPLFLVAATAPLLQQWLADTRHPSAHDPYFLYAAGNLGSLLALVVYPLLLEQNLAQCELNVAWLVAFGLLAGLLLVAAALAGLAPRLFHAAPVGAPPPPPGPVKAETDQVVDAELAERIRYAREERETPREDPAAIPDAAPRPARTSEALTIPEASGPPTVLRRLRWLVLSAVPASLLLGLTAAITLDIAPGPLFWAVPLALYLFTFIQAFARIPLWEHLNFTVAVLVQVAHGVVLAATTAGLILVPLDPLPREMLGGLVLVLIVLIPYRWVVVVQPLAVLALVIAMVSQEIPIQPVPFALHLAAFYLTARLCHRELARDRPAPAHLTAYFLWVALGGVLGGLFNAFLAPLVFLYGPAEYGAALILGCMARPAWLANGLLDGLLVLAISTLSRAGDTARRWLRRLLALAFDLAVPVVPAVLALVLLGMASAPTWGPNKRDLRQWLFEQAYQDAAKTRDYKGVELVHLKYAAIVYGVPLLLCLLVVARPLRFALALGAVFALYGVYPDSAEQRRSLYVDRSPFGFLRVYEGRESLFGGKGNVGPVELRYHYLMHGSTHHGLNYLGVTSAGQPGQPNYQRQATTYYHRRGPVGRVMEKYNWFPDPDHTYAADARLPASLVGLGQPGLGPWPALGQLAGACSEPPLAVIGLGTGTMASYARPFQPLHFFEIDPKVVDLSLPPPGQPRYFHFLEDARARGANVRVFGGDGRLSLQHHGPDAYYQVIVVDAFTSDAIPFHLLTREAFQLYFQKLAPGGVVCVHTSNRHLDLTGVIADVAHELHYACVLGKDSGGSDRQARDPGHFGSEWVMVARTTGDLAHLHEPPAPPDRFDPRPGPALTWQRLHSSGSPAWTDDRASVVAIARDSTLTALMRVLLLGLAGLALVLIPVEQVARILAP
jgi:hypothetical protein